VVNLALEKRERVIMGGKGRSEIRGEIGKVPGICTFPAAILHPQKLHTFFQAIQGGYIYNHPLSSDPQSITLLTKLNNSS
jgi:hypothetical protein